MFFLYKTTSKFVMCLNNFCHIFPDGWHACLKNNYAETGYNMAALLVKCWSLTKLSIWFQMVISTVIKMFVSVKPAIK